MRVSPNTIRRNLAYLAPFSVILTVVLLFAPLPFNLTHGEEKVLCVLAGGLIWPNIYVYRNYFRRKKS